MLRQEKYQKNAAKGALRVALPRAKDALSYVPLPSRTCSLQSTLTSKTATLIAFCCQRRLRSRRSADFMSSSLQAKSRNTFCSNRIEVKVLQRHRKCGPGRVHREGWCSAQRIYNCNDCRWQSYLYSSALIAGAINSAPSLCRLLLVLFLAKQEKYITSFRN